MSHHQEPLIRCFSQHHRTLKKKKINQSRTFGCLFEPWMSPLTCTTHWPVMSKQRYFIKSPAVWETLCVTFLVNRHVQVGWRGGGGGGRRGAIKQFVKVFFQKKCQDMVLIQSYAEWQNHCSFCAVVVVSVAHERPVGEMQREKE